MANDDEKKTLREIVDEEVDRAVERERAAASRFAAYSFLIAALGGYALGLLAGWAMR